MRRFGFQSWDDGTRLYRASRGPAILPHPLFRLEPCRCWCGAGANQPNPTHQTHSPSPVPPRLNQPPFSSFAFHFLLLLLLRCLLLVLFLLYLLLLLPLLVLLVLPLLLLLLLPLLLYHPQPATHYYYLPPSFASTCCFSFSCLHLSAFQTTPAFLTFSETTHTQTHARKSHPLVLLIDVIRISRTNSQPRPIARDLNTFFSYIGDESTFNGIKQRDLEIVQC